MPELHLAHVFDVEPVETDAVKAVRKWRASGKRILVLSGGVDAGKSGAAAWACCEAMGMYITTDKLRHAFGFDAAAVRTMERLENVDVLVVDDMGSEYADAKGFSASGLASLISARYDHRLRRIITTNIDRATFEEKQPRLYSRLQEAGTWMNCETAGFRAPKK